MNPPSEQLKDLRKRLGLTTRDIAEFSHKIAEANGLPEFAISTAWLTQIENSESVPSVFKLYSLSVIYRIRFSDLLALYGVDLANIGRDAAGIGLPRQTGLYKTQIFQSDGVGTSAHDSARATTSLLDNLDGSGGYIPALVLRQLDLKNFVYGFIGTEDDFLSPLVRPGSFVQIDPRQNAIPPTIWRTEFDRPIYFVSTPDRYVSAWCEIAGDDILLLPHPLSNANVLKYKYRNEIEIVGRVVGVAMRIGTPLMATDRYK